MPQGKSSINKIWIVLAVVLTVLGVVLFGAYAYYLPVISDDHAAWSSFGSLLSGFFTLGGVIATIATLLFLNSQNQDQQEFIKSQIQNQTFEQYINHRRLFTELLSETQTILENKIRFINPGKLYSTIFKKNRPMNVVLSVHLTADDFFGSLQLKCIHLHGLINNLSNAHELDTGVLVKELLSIMDYLQIEWVGDASDGDIFYKNKNSGINIYSLDEYFERINVIYAFLISFSGNAVREVVGGIPLQEATAALIRHFVRTIPLLGYLMREYRSLPNLVVLEQLWIFSNSLTDENNNLILPHTINILNRILSSRTSVAAIHHDEIINDIKKVCAPEVESAETRLNSDAERLLILQNCKLSLRLLDITTEEERSAIINQHNNPAS